MTQEDLAFVVVVGLAMILLLGWPIVTLYRDGKRFERYKQERAKVEARHDAHLRDFDERMARMHDDVEPV